MSSNSVAATYTLRTGPDPNLKSHGVLYSFPGSIAATMARFTLSVIPNPVNAGSESKVGGQELEIKTQNVDILDGSEQLTEEYLCDVNPNGSVPSLVISNDARSPFTSNVAIVERLVELFPSLAPEPHKDDVVRLVRELHAHKFFPISNGTEGGKPRMATQAKNMNALLQQSNISERHRSALENKKRLNEEKEISTQAENVERQLQSIRKYVEKISALIEKNNDGATDTPTVFGTQRLTALDAQLAPALVRLQLTGHDEYLGNPNSPLRRFLQHIRSLDEWKTAARGFHQEGSD